MSLNLTEHLAPKIKKDDPGPLPNRRVLPRRAEPRERRLAFDGFFYFTAALVVLSLVLQLYLMVWMEIF